MSNSLVDDLHLHHERFVEIPGMRGLRVARVGQSSLNKDGLGDGKTLEVIEGQHGVVIPAMQHPSAEHGRVLKGRIRFMQDGVVRELKAGDTWTVAAGAAQGPHVVLVDDTRVAILRDGKSSFDVV